MTDLKTTAFWLKVSTTFSIFALFGLVLLIPVLLSLIASIEQEFDLEKAEIKLLSKTILKEVYREKRLNDKYHDVLKRAALKGECNQTCRPCHCVIEQLQIFHSLSFFQSMLYFQNIFCNF